MPKFAHIKNKQYFCTRKQNFHKSLFIGICGYEIGNSVKFFIYYGSGTENDHITAAGIDPAVFLLLFSCIYQNFVVPLRRISKINIL